MGTIHFRINRNGGPTPCWVRMVDSEGKPKVPFGRNLAASREPLRDVGGHWITDRGLWTAESGSFEMELESGLHRIDVLKAPAWAGASVKEISVLTRQLSVRMALDEPLINPHGWVAGDLRVHGISPQIARIEAEASGMGVVQVQAAYRWPDAASASRYHELLEFSGTRPAASGETAVVAVNTLNRHPLLGSVSLLHAHRPIYPWGWGWDSREESGEKDWAVGDWLRQCHRIKGVTFWPELDCDLPEYEVMAALVLGDVDVVELSTSLGRNVEDPRSRLPLLYSLFDHGIFPALAGASGKDSNRTRTGEKFTWVDCGMPGVDSGTQPEARLEKATFAWTANESGLDRFMSRLKTRSTVASIGPWFAFASPFESENLQPKRIFEISYLGMIAGARLQMISGQGVLWEMAVEDSAKPQSYTAILEDDPQGWFALRLLDATGRLLAHGSAQSSGKRQPLPLRCRNGVIRSRLQDGLNWLQQGRAGYFTPQIASYLENAITKLDR